MKDTKELIAELSRIISPPGGERAMREYIKEFIGENVPAASVEEDGLGNLAVTVGGGSGRLVMVTSSVDESVFAVNEKDSGGCFRFASLGELSPSAAAYSETEFEVGVRGTLVPTSKGGERGDKADDVLSYAVDTNGADVPSGTAFRPVSAMTVAGDSVTAPSAAAKAGAAVLLCAAALAAEEKTVGRVCFLFASQGKVGARSVGPAARRIRPDVAVAVGAAESDCGTGGFEPGSGPCVLFAAERLVCDPDTSDALVSAADRAGVNCVKKAGGKTAPDALAAAKLLAEGVPASFLGIPARYIGTPREKIDVRDVCAAAKVILEFAKGKD